MKKQKKSDDAYILVINETIDSFFARGKNTAKALDQKKRLPPRRVISFEDPLQHLSSYKSRLLCKGR